MPTFRGQYCKSHAYTGDGRCQDRKREQCDDCRDTEIAALSIDAARVIRKGGDVAPVLRLCAILEQRA